MQIDIIATQEERWLLSEIPARQSEATQYTAVMTTLHGVKFRGPLRDCIKQARADATLFMAGCRP